MRILIAYASYNSTAETCAKLLAERLPETDIVNLAKSKPDISKYDTVIIGSCIRFNEIHKAAKDFIGNNLDVLMKMNTAIYLCCAFTEKSNQYLLFNFPKKLLDKSVSIQCFGGRLKAKPYKLYDKIILKIVKRGFKVDNRKPIEIDYESISNMVNDILEIN